jgi:hypothetical protein
MVVTDRIVQTPFVALPPDDSSFVAPHVQSCAGFESSTDLFIGRALETLHYASSYLSSRCLIT